jgi:uncharacterized LabA/DUF88 family protein
MKVACYIDGFNLYHAIDAFKDATLKWTDLHSLAKSYLREGEALEKVAFFTALNTWDRAKRQRHVNYVKALQESSVKVVLSRFETPKKFCHKNERYCPIREEKQTDVALAIEMLADCIELGIDRVLLITADSDQVPAVTQIKRLFPETSVFMIAPPKRLAVARELSGICDGRTELTQGRIRQHQLPMEIRAKGKLIAARPAIYGDRIAFAALGQAAI